MGCLTKVLEPNLLYYLPIAGREGGKNRWINAFSKGICTKRNTNSLVRVERIADSFSYDYNHYAKHALDIHTIVFGRFCM